MQGIWNKNRHSIRLIYNRIAVESSAMCFIMKLLKYHSMFMFFVSLARSLLSVVFFLLSLSFPPFSIEFYFQQDTFRPEITKWYSGKKNETKQQKKNRYSQHAKSFTLRWQGGTPWSVSLCRWKQNQLSLAVSLAVHPLNSMMLFIWDAFLLCSKNGNISDWKCDAAD